MGIATQNRRNARMRRRRDKIVKIRQMTDMAMIAPVFAVPMTVIRLMMRMPGVIAIMVVFMLPMLVTHSPCSRFRLREAYRETVPHHFVIQSAVIGDMDGFFRAFPCLNQFVSDPVCNRRRINMRLKGKTAFITGAGQGLGFAFAKRLAEDGADIIVADIAKAGDAAAKLAAMGTRTVGVTMDVSKEADVAAAVAEGLKAMGRIDILINNAAFFATMTHGPFEQIGVEEWSRMMNVNVLGTYLCCRAVVPQMRKQGNGGRIINMASGTALKGVPGSLHYVTSKGAIIALTRSLARELGKDNITVNAIAPGLTLSDGVIDRGGMNEERLVVQRRTRAIQRDEKPEDLVGAASFLASEDAAFMTGQTLAVDGGSAML